MSQPYGWLKFLSNENKENNLTHFILRQVFVVSAIFLKTEHKMQHTKLYICKLKFCGNWQLKTFNFIPFCSNMLSFTKEGYTIIANIILFVISYKKLPWIFLQKKSQIMICTFNVKYGFQLFWMKTTAVGSYFDFFANTNFFVC